MSPLVVQLGAEWLSPAWLARLNRELGIKPKTVAKWRKRATVKDAKTGPKAPHSLPPFELLEHLLKAVPCRICIILTDNGIPHEIA